MFSKSFWCNYFHCFCFLNSYSSPPSLTHEVGHNFAHRGAKDEVLEDAGDEREGHTDNRHHQVADSQRQQEGVGHRAHAFIDCQHHDDQKVSNHAEEEDE